MSSVAIFTQSATRQGGQIYLGFSPFPLRTFCDQFFSQLHDKLFLKGLFSKKKKKKKKKKKGKKKCAQKEQLFSYLLEYTS